MEIGFNYGIVISLSMAFIINRTNNWIKTCLQLYPKNVIESNNEYLNWKWRNFLVSFTHSVVTGIGSLMCVLHLPNLLLDVVEAYLEFAYILTSASHGYFIYDLIEMISKITYKGSKELVLHHIMILTCFSITVIQHKYVGYSCIALLIELSNIFLHLRQLMLIANYSKSSIYTVVSIINIITFVVVRGLCLFWLWYTLFLVLPKVPIISKMIAFTSLTVICGITIILLFRLIKSDFMIHKSTINCDISKAKSGTNGQLIESVDKVNDQIISSESLNNGFVSQDFQMKITTNTLRLRDKS